MSRTKSKVLVALCTSVALLALYVITRHDVLGEWHNIHQFPLLLTIAGLATIIIASFAGATVVAVLTPVSYIAGFITAWMFNISAPGPNGMTNNGWLIWAMVMLAAVVFGVSYHIALYLHRPRRKR